MAKKTFANPFILLTGWGGDGSDTGGGSGGTSDDATYWDFYDWQETVGGSDLDGDGDVDFGDYILWWQSQGYPAELLEEINPDWDSYDPNYYKK